MGCVGEASGSMCYPDAESNPKAAGNRIMRLQLTLTLKNGDEKKKNGQERKIKRVWNDEEGGYKSKILNCCIYPVIESCCIPVHQRLHIHFYLTSHS